MGIVFDTNIVVSALLWGGPPKAAIDLAATDQFDILSPQQFLQQMTPG